VQRLRAEGHDGVVGTDRCRTEHFGPQRGHHGRCRGDAPGRGRA
jgi:hypothetical protein